MEERNYGAEIDALRDELREIKGLLTGEQGNSEPETLPMVNHVHPMRNMHPDKRLSDLMEEMCTNAGTMNQSGLVTSLGVFSSGGRQSNWIDRLDAGSLLKLAGTKEAESVIGCVGNGDRLNLLMILLNEPKTVAELVENHGYTSTGQVYHHLKPLMANGIVCEESRGRYAVPYDKVKGLLLLLAGVSALTGE